MPTRKKLLHVRSNRPLTGDATKPQLPESSFLDYGELAINYGEGIETLSIKNSGNDIVTFSSDIYNSNTYTTKEETIENELVVATALTEHEDRLDGLDETVAGKQDALTFDSTPTASSLNPVTSGGIKEYVDNATDDALVIECSGGFMDSVSSADTLTITNGITAVDVIEAYNDGKKIIIQHTYTGENSGDVDNGSLIYTVLGSVKTQENEGIISLYGVGFNVSTPFRNIFLTDARVRYFLNVQHNETGSSSDDALRIGCVFEDHPIITNDTDHENVKLQLGVELVSGSPFEPIFRYDSSDPTTASPTVAYLSDLENKQDAPLVVNITATTNGYTSDVTFADALAAFEAHKDVYINGTFSSGNASIEYGKYKVIGKSNYNDPLDIMSETAEPMLYAIERHYETLEHVIKWTANNITLETNNLYAVEQVNGSYGGINIKNLDGASYFGINEYGKAYWSYPTKDTTDPDTLATLGDITSQLTSIFTYKGTIGTNGTVSTLPANAAVGDTYQAVAGCPDVNNKAVEEGDLVVNIGTNAWTVVQNNIVVDTQLDSTSHNPVENAAITEIIRNNERVIAIALTRVNDNAGFNTDGEYDPQGTNYIADSSSLAQSADLLDAAVGSLDAAVDALAAQVSSGALWETGTGTNSLIPKNSGNTASGAKSMAIGNSTQATNSGELATGSYNSSTTANNGTETLFSVGNGTSSTRHNAFEVKGNGDIKLTLNEEDVILQEYLNDNEEVISSALNDLDTRVLANEYNITQLQTSKQNAFIAGSGLTLSGNSLYANTATATTLGVVKGGGNVTIAADGTLNTTVTVEVDDELDGTSTNPVENRVITNTIRDNETVTAAALTKIKESVGLENNGDYSPSGTNYISNASSLTEAVDILDGAIDDAISDAVDDIASTYVTQSQLEDANPIVLVDYWTTDNNAEPSDSGITDGMLWYDQYNTTLHIRQNGSWATATMNLRKLYINVTHNEIWRYNGTSLIRMTINPTSLVTT